MDYNKSLIIQKIVEKNKNVQFVVLTTLVFEVESLLILDYQFFQPI